MDLVTLKLIDSSSVSFLPHSLNVLCKRRITLSLIVVGKACGPRGVYKVNWLSEWNINVNFLMIFHSRLKRKVAPKTRQSAPVKQKCYCYYFHSLSSAVRLINELNGCTWFRWWRIKDASVNYLWVRRSCTGLSGVLTINFGLLVTEHDITMNNTFYWCSGAGCSSYYTRMSESLWVCQKWLEPVKLTLRIIQIEHSGKALLKTTG